MIEADHQGRIIDLLRIHGCIVAHFRPAQTKHGWRTAVAADGAGFHDLVAMSTRKGIVLFIEVKGDGGRVSPDQRRWHDAATLAQEQGTNVHHFVLYPKDWMWFVDWCADHL